MSTVIAPQPVNLEPSPVEAHPRLTDSVVGTPIHDIHSHVMSPQLLISVFASLVFLTLATVGVAQLSLGNWEVGVSLGIATVKASLVAVYFMHLRYDKAFHGIVFVSSLAFVALFLGLTMMDIQPHEPS